MLLAGALLVAMSFTFAHAETAKLPAPAAAVAGEAVDDVAGMSRFLDHLMLAESGGRDTARNPRSTALGPFQFIESTFLEVARRHFPADTDKLSPDQVLRLRTNRAFARRAAEAYTRDNAGILAAAGQSANFANLRLAFLLGPGGALRVLEVPRDSLAIRVVGAAVVQANPFMAGMTTGDLIRWSKANLAAGALAGAEIKGNPPSHKSAGPQIAVRCDRGLASCRRWIALAKRRVTGKVAAGARAGRRR